ncbi:MAG: serine hydrolase [Verrucomicrobiota bacterium]
MPLAEDQIDALFKDLTKGESSGAAVLAGRDGRILFKKGLEQGYGYGWSIGKFRGLKTISHGGGLNGFLSQLERYPEQKLTVAVLVNAASPAPGLSPGALAQEIAQAYLWKEMKPRESFKVATSVNPTTFDAYCSGRRIEDTFPFPELPQESAKSARVGAFASSCAFLWLCIP